MRHQRLKSYIGYSSLAGGSAEGDSAGGKGGGGGGGGGAGVCAPNKSFKYNRKKP